MKKLPKFMKAKNEMAAPGEVFYVHTRKPAFVARLVEGHYQITGLGDPIDMGSDRFNGLMRRMHDWMLAERTNSQAYRRTRTDDEFKYPRSSYYITENILDWDGQLAITKLSPPMVFVRFAYADSYFATFEQFRDALTVVEWIGGEKPDEEEQEAILADCWNFLALHEEEEESRYERGEYDDDDF